MSSLVLGKVGLRANYKDSIITMMYQHITTVILSVEGPVPVEGRKPVKGGKVSVYTPDNVEPFTISTTYSEAARLHDELLERIIEWHDRNMTYSHGEVTK